MRNDHYTLIVIFLCHIYTDVTFWSWISLFLSLLFIYLFFCAVRDIINLSLTSTLSTSTVNRRGRPSSNKKKQQQYEKSIAGVQQKLSNAKKEKRRERQQGSTSTGKSHHSCISHRLSLLNFITMMNEHEL